MEMLPDTSKLFKYNIDTLQVDVIHLGQHLCARKEVVNFLKPEIWIDTTPKLIKFMQVFVSHIYYNRFENIIEKVFIHEFDFDNEQFRLFILYLLQSKIQYIDVHDESPSLIFHWNNDQKSLVFKTKCFDKKSSYLYMDYIFNAILDIKTRTESGKFSTTSDTNKIIKFFSELKMIDAIIEEKYIDLIRFCDNLTHLSIRIGSAKLPPYMRYYTEVKNLRYFRYVYPIGKDLNPIIKFLIDQNATTLVKITVCSSYKDNVLNTIASSCKTLKHLALKLITENERTLNYFVENISRIKSLEKLTFLAIHQIPLVYINIIKAEIPNINIYFHPNKNE